MEIAATVVRHASVLDVEQLAKLRVTILGVGAGGLTIALLLAKLGARRILVCDKDVVAPENLGPSLYEWDQALSGKRKTDACAEMIWRATRVEIETRHGDVAGLETFGDVVFLCLDSNDLKWHTVKRIASLGDAMPERIFEGRMSASNFLTHSFSPRNPQHLATWERFYLPDADTADAVPACGAARVVLSSVGVLAAGTIVQHFIDWLMWKGTGKRGDLVNQVFCDMAPYRTEPDSWGE